MIHAVIVGLVVLLTPGVGHTRQAPRERSQLVIYHAAPPKITQLDGNPLHYPPYVMCQCAPPLRIALPVDLLPVDLPPIDARLMMPANGVGNSAVETWDGPSQVGRNYGEPTPNGVFSSDVVDVSVIPYVGSPTPQYPEALREAGIEGEVTLEFVVDTTGRVEGGSVRVLSSAADAFVVSVRDALAGTRYHPALVGGRRVRQLVRQGFVFSLTQH